MNGKTGTAPIEIEAAVGQPVVLDAAGTTDPDGHALKYSWIYYGEAGTGIPDLPVRQRRRSPAGAAPGAGGIPSSPSGGPPQPPPRVTIDDPSSPKVTVYVNSHRTSGARLDSGHPFTRATPSSWNSLTGSPGSRRPRRGSP